MPWTRLGKVASLCFCGNLDLTYFVIICFIVASGRPLPSCAMLGCVSVTRRVFEEEGSYFRWTTVFKNKDFYMIRVY